MKVIGFVGPKGAGKDEAYRILKDSGKVYRKMSFAAPFKQICKEVFQLTDYQVDHPDGKERPFETPITLTNRHIREIRKLLPDWVDPIDPETGLVRYNANKISVVGLEGRVFNSPRELLQIIGTDLIRDRVNPNWHVMAALGDKALELLSNPTAIYAVTDVRFENELASLQEKFGESFLCYYIERPEAEERLKTATHPSELLVKNLREKLGPDAVIQNSGTIEEFEAVLKNIKIPSEGFKLPKKSKFVYGARN